MPIANAYKEAVQNIINKLNAEVTPTKPRRHLATLVSCASNRIISRLTCGYLYYPGSQTSLLARILCVDLQFQDLPDPATWVDYYTIITEPRSLNGVQEKLQKNRYRNIIDVLNDLHLVFANALHYNEASSQIAKDAAILKVSSCIILE
jgi:hypothetical protein